MPVMTMHACSQSDGALSRRNSRTSAAAPLRYAFVAARVSATAATAAITGPADPTATRSRSASGTALPAREPRTVTVATANARYTVVVTANAIAITLGSCRAGSRKRAVSGAIASQPMNDSISTEAAWPSDVQPCGANGVAFDSRADGAEPATANTTRMISTATSTSCAAVVARAPARVSASTAASNSAAASTPTVRPPPSNSATYAPPIRQTTGAPTTTPARKHQPTARPGRTPRPAAV